MWPLYVVSVKDVVEPMMLNKLNIILVCLSTVAVAVFVTLIPDVLPVTSLLRMLAGGRQPLGVQMKEEMGCCGNGQHAAGLNTLQLRATSMLQVSRPPVDDLKGEALAALHIAKEHLAHDKDAKALKLYRHAIALAPNHPDVLNEYGEFLERNQKDVVTAEHLYCRALIASPTHSRALQNRKRTLPLVVEIDHNSFSRIDKKRDMLVNVPDSHPAMRRMKKESYFHHIYHTAAIEGNTFTLSQTRSLVETRLAIAGKSIMEHNEILGLEAALNFVNSTLVHRIGSVTIDDILNIHKRVLGFVDPVGAGQFRTTQVFVGSFVPPEAKEIDKLMYAFVSWLNSAEAMSFHPIELAALAHYKLVSIHPFYDGNGRTSRLLMNFILMQAGYPPVTIHKEEKLEYYEHLESANEGDVRPFIRFISRCTERTLNQYLWATTENSSIVLADIRPKEVDSRTIVMEDPESEE